MKKLSLFILAFFASCSLAFSQTPAAFFAKYPLVKSDFCSNCYLEVNPYYSAIIDDSLRESMVTYGNYTPEKESQVVALKVDRGKYGTWHAYPGRRSESKFYNDINKGITNSLMKYAKGHYAAFILCAWTVEGAVASCTYDINEGIENQGQNEGTEGEVEALTRALVGSTSTDAKKVHYSGPVFSRVDYWKGSWGSFKVFNVDGITKNYSAVYWNLLKYGVEVHAYWFPNDISASHDYQSYEIPFDHEDPDSTKVGLIQRLGFDPTQAIKPAD